MPKRLAILVLVGFMAINLCGCIAVMASLANTAKEKQTVNVSYSDAIDVVKGAMKALEIKFISADIRQNIAEAKGKYVDGRTVRIFVSKISDTESQIAVRVGTTQTGKEDAKKIMQAIIDYADLTTKKIK